MTDAYIAGFCKTAAAMGVDPQALVTQAKIGTLLHKLKLAITGRPAVRQGVLNDPVLRGVNDLLRDPSKIPSYVLASPKRDPFTVSGATAVLRAIKARRLFDLEKQRLLPKDSSGDVVSNIGRRVKLSRMTEKYLKHPELSMDDPELIGLRMPRRDRLADIRRLVPGAPEPAAMYPYDY